MVTNYLIELLYLGVYIAICNVSDVSLVISKLYFSSLIIYNSLIVYYIIMMIFRGKYNLSDSLYDKKINKLRCGLIFVDIVTLIVILMLSNSIDGNVFYGIGVTVSYFMMFIYSIVGFLIIFTDNKYIDKNRYRDLFVIGIINVICIIIQYYFYDITIINSGYVIVTLYMYLTLENSSYREIERLKLENDTAMKSSIDTTKFLSNMSYEIRTPLNAIDGLSQVIEDSDDIIDIKEDIRDIRVASKNLIDIINGIIDIASIDNGKMEIVNENYDIYTMLDNVCDIVKSKLKDSDVEFKIDIADNIPAILVGDSAKIEQILLNLLTNSIKYTEKGYILFKVDVINSTSLCRLKLTVSDTGKGIEEDKINSLFNRFDNSKKEDSNKLGLVIVKKLVDLMGGKIDVDSKYDKGTTFVVTIDQKVVSDLNSESLANKKRNLDIIDLSDKRILVVDDNKLNLKVAEKLLNPYNAEVTICMSGQECLDILDNDTNFDLILMDDMMPNMSGSEALSVILKLERIDGFHIPIVVLTANAISGMKEKYINLGFDDYLAKPIDKYELNRVIKKYLNK